MSELMVVAVGRLRPGVPSTLNAFCVSDYPKGTSPHLWGFPNQEKNVLEASFYGEEVPNNQDRSLTQKFKKFSPGYYQHFFSIYGSHNNYQNGFPFAGHKKPFYNSNNPYEDFKIISVYYPIVDDRCNRLFVIDTGVLQYSPTEIYEVQSPALIVFDLPGNGCQTRDFPLIRRVEIPGHLWKTQAGFSIITLDYQKKGSCDDLILYITNTLDSNVISYDYRTGNFWSTTDNSMKPIMSESYVLFKGNTYQLPIGIGNVALGWPDKFGNRLAYFAPGSSLGEYVVNTKVLKSSKRSFLKHSSEDFTLIGYRGCNTQGYRQVFDKSTGVMFFGEMQSKRISCWNTRLPLNPDTVGVVFESNNLEFVSAIFLDSDGYLWFHSNQLPIIFLTHMPLDVLQINSRTFRVKASDAILGTVCDPF